MKTLPDVPSVVMVVRGLLGVAVVALASCSRGGDGGDRTGGESSPVQDVIPVTVANAVDTTIGEVHTMAEGLHGIWGSVSPGPQLVLFGPDGSPQEHFLTRGAGPDQGGRVLSVESDHDGNAIVWDGEYGRVLEVSPIGTVRSIREGASWRASLAGPARQLLGGIPLQIASVQTGLVVGVVEGLFYSTSDFARLTLIHDDGHSRDTLWSFNATARWLDSVQPGRPIHQPFPLWARCGRTALAIYDPRDQRTRLIDLRGRDMGSWEVPMAPAMLSEQEVRYFILNQLRDHARGSVPEEQLKRMAFEAPTSALDSLSRLAPAYARLFCTESGSILLQRFEASEARASGTELWDVFGGKGRAQILQLPVNFRLRAANDSQLVGVALDELDVPRVAVGRWSRLR